MELARFGHWLGDLQSFGFPKRELKGRLCGLKALLQLVLHGFFLEITGPVKVS